MYGIEYNDTNKAIYVRVSAALRPAECGREWYDIVMSLPIEDVAVWFAYMSDDTVDAPIVLTDADGTLRYDYYELVTFIHRDLFEFDGH